MSEVEDKELLKRYYVIGTSDRACFIQRIDDDGDHQWTDHLNKAYLFNDWDLACYLSNSIDDDPGMGTNVFTIVRPSKERREILNKD
jgi:hypothetical protein